jgi:hypothetical protein
MDSNLRPKANPDPKKNFRSTTLRMPMLAGNEGETVDTIEELYRRNTNLLRSQRKREILEYWCQIHWNRGPSKQGEGCMDSQCSVLGQLIKAFHYMNRHTFIGLYMCMCTLTKNFQNSTWAMKKSLRSRIWLHLRRWRHQLDTVNVFKFIHGYDYVEKSQQ